MHDFNNNDSDGYESVTQKVHLRCFKLYRAYSILFSSSNIGNFFWSLILKDCIKVQEKKNSLSRFGVKLWNEMPCHIRDLPKKNIGKYFTECFRIS